MKYLFLLYADAPMPEPGTPQVECDGLDEALRWAARLPTALDGKVEVRPVLQVPGA